MELRDYVRILRRRWRSIVALVVLGGLAGLAFALASPKVYSAQSKVYVALTTSSSSAAYQGLQYVLGQMPSYAQLDGSAEVLSPVIAELGLHESVQQFAADVHISNPTGTTYLDVEASASSFGRAEHIANLTGRQLATVIESLGPGSQTARGVVVANTQPATGSSTPVSPQPVLDVGLGLVTGLVLGMIVAIARFRLDTRIRTVTDLSDLTGVAPLAHVPAHSFDENLRGPSADEVTAFRVLRTNLALTSGGHLPPSLVVVAGDSADGPDVAVNLAQVAARSGITTCVVEADLRRPRLAELFLAPPPTGLTDVLGGRADLEEAVQTWPDEAGLVPAVLMAGPAADDPADLLDSARMRHVHRVLAANFDLVVYVSPPARDHPDAVILARDAAAAVLVARAGASARPAFTHAAESFAEVGARVAGAVLVESSARGRRRRLDDAGPSGRTLLPTTEPSTTTLRDPASFPPAGRDGFTPPLTRAPDGATGAVAPRRPARGSSLMPPRARSSRTRRLEAERDVVAVDPVSPSDPDGSGSLPNEADSAEGRGIDGTAMTVGSSLTP